MTNIYSTLMYHTPVGEILINGVKAHRLQTSNTCNWFELLEVALQGAHMRAHTHGDGTYPELIMMPQTANMLYWQTTYP